MSKKIKYLTLAGSLAIASGVGAQVYLCQQCYPGTYAPAGSTTCKSCPGGRYAKYSGQASCDICPAGTYATFGAKECTQCRAGTYASSPGASACVSCPAGTYSSTVGATSSATCQKCPAGTYSYSGASSCTPCPDYKWSSEGSSYCSDIYFRIWYYHKNPYNTQYRWLLANNTTHSCTNDYMGWDPNKGETKYCSFRYIYNTSKEHSNREILYLTKEGRTFSFDCKSLPCTIYKDKETYYTAHSDKSLEICNYVCIEDEDDDGWYCTGEYEWDCSTYPNQIDWW